MKTRGKAKPTKSSPEQKAPPAPAKKASKPGKRKAPSPPPKTLKADDKENKKKDQKDDSPKKIVKAVVKGTSAVDPHFPGLGNYRVYVDLSGKAYDATLNQANVNMNNNKYYIIQIVEDENVSGMEKYYFFNRWGRVGHIAGTTKKGPMTLDKAIREYNSKFNDKTVSGNYRVLEISNESNEEEEEKSDKGPIKKKNDYEESKLAKPIKDLLSLIFDMKMMNDYMKEIGYDAKKLPLGKLSKSNIEKGYEFLRELAKIVKAKGSAKGKSNEIADLSNDFYSYIPHDFGFQFSLHLK